MVELVDTPDLGSGDESRGGSSPLTRTKVAVQSRKGFNISFYCKAKRDIYYAN